MDDLDLWEIRCRIEHCWPSIANAFALPLDQFFARLRQLEALRTWWQGDETDMNRVEREAVANLRREARQAKRARRNQHG